MKKILLSVGILFAAASVNAQIFQHGFEGGTPLAGWTTHGTTGATVTTNGGSALDGTGLTGSTHWVVANGVGTGNTSGSNQALTTSYFDPVVQADNYLVTPMITLPAGASYRLMWHAGSYGSSNYLDPYEIKINTTGTSKADFSGATATLYTSTGASNSGEDLQLTIPATFSGQNIYIAFVATGNDDYVIGFDDIVVETIPQDDIILESVSIDPMIAPGNYTITGVVKNNGANTITSFDVDWNDGTSHNATISGVSIPTDGTYNFSHTTDLVGVAGASHTIDVCATVTGDSDASNNCINGSNLTVASQEGTKLALLELFTSSTCPPCEWLNYDGFDGSGLNTYLSSENVNAQSGSGFACIKYQVNWPGVGDHSYNSEVGTRVSNYSVSGAPTPIVDGTAYGFTTFNSADVTTHKNNPAFVDISATHSTSGGTVTVDVEIDPYSSWSGAKLYIALLDKEYDAGTTSDFSNGETEFHHVFRKFIANGTPMNLTSGTQYTTSKDYSYTFTSGFPSQGSFDLHAESTQEIIVFAEDASGNILNAAISTGDFASNDEIENELGLSIFPNPTNDIANVTFNVTEYSKVTVEVINTLGQVISSNDLGNVVGNQSLELETKDLEAGMYIVNINVNGTITSNKLSVRK